jgi:phage terminase Nu1 subunit (DNA packaging protein)
MSTITVSDFAELVGVSTRTVSDLVKRGVISKVGAGLPHPESLQRYVGHLREQAAGRGGEAAAEVSSHRASLLKIQAERAQFRLEQERELWVTVADVEAHWESALRTLRAGVLAIPTRVASRTPGVTREMSYEWDQEVREALTELARNGYPAPGSPDDLLATTKEDAA